MNTLNLNVLETLSEKNFAENINQIFIELVNEIHSYLKLDIINSQVKIKYVSENIASKKEATEILDLGVRRNIEETYVEIEILDSYKKFLPLILLREAYYCFVPDGLKNNETIKIFINQIIENDLQSLEITKEWKLLIRNLIVNYEFLSSLLDRLEKFLKFPGSETLESATIFFFEYIRKNIYLEEHITEDFYPNLYKEFLLKISKSMNNNEIIETLYVLINIFYKVKSYRALLDYKKYFIEFKKSGVIQTELSLRKFTKNLYWINNFSYVAPSYQINWKSINMASILCQIKFNPLIEKSKINRVIKKMPFFVDSKSSENNFAIEFSGWFVIPISYLNDLKTFIKKMEDFNYIIDKNCFIYSKVQNNLNLNYFREFYKAGRLINPNHTLYDNKYEITFEIKHSQKHLSHEFSLLEFLLLDRVKYWSFAGFSFEKTTKNLNFLKSDLINEIISQKALINDLKKNLQIFHRNEELKAKLLIFLEEYKEFGFFYLQELLENLISTITLAIAVLTENTHIKNVYQFQEFIKKRGIAKSIEENIIINSSEIKKIVYRQLISQYFQDKNSFIKKLKNFQIFNDFFNSCFNLKIFKKKLPVKILTIY